MKLNLRHSFFGWTGIVCAASGGIACGLGLLGELGLLPLGSGPRGWLIPLGCILACGPQVIELVAKRSSGRRRGDEHAVETAVASGHRDRSGEGSAGRRL